MRPCRPGCSSVLLMLLAAVMAAASSQSATTKMQRAAITKVHLVQSNHLDVGFTGSILTVLNEYFDSYLTGAVATSAALKRKGGEEQLVFTTHAYVLSLFLDCPAGRGLHCPTPAAVATVEDALRDGSIALHAFPFNSELDMYDASLIEAGVELSASISTRYGQSRPTVLSQRDVPGMTQAIVPVLAKLGVQAISVGCNNAAQPPDVPSIFRWQAPNGGNSSVIGLVHAGGYAELKGNGGCDDMTGNDGCLRTHKGEDYLVDGCDEALVMAWNSDNQGPPAESDVLLTFKSTRQLYPNAKIVASTMDAFITAIQPHVASLPVVKGEIADNWIYGVGSDPYKVAVMRAAARSRSAYLAGAAAGAMEDKLLNFSRQLLKGGEHTWGTDTQGPNKANTGLSSNVWTNAELERARHNRSAGADGIGLAVESPCPGLHGNARPQPPCPEYWYAPDSVSCTQGCPSGAQKRDPATGRCRCGEAAPNDVCLRGLQCINSTCVECAVRPKPAPPGAAFRRIEKMWREQRLW